MARVGGAPAAERLAGEFAERGDQLRLLEQPLLVAFDHLLAGAVTTDDERVAPLRRPADGDVVARTLAMDDERVCQVVLLSVSRTRFPFTRWRSSSGYGVERLSIWGRSHARW
jgi:hypothetical protein